MNMCNMAVQYKINSEYRHLEKEILNIPACFDTQGEVIYKGRNVLKVFEIGGIRMCVKSYKKPHLINQVAYAYLRKSKAERAYIYANRFLELGVATPAPIAYILYKSRKGLFASYYICLQEDNVNTLREVLKLSIEEQRDIFRAFTQFTYDFQQKGVFFMDHSMGNTLVRKENGIYRFFLVDLNRTHFRTISYKKGLKNLSLLELEDSMLEVIGKEYARLTEKDEEKTIKRLIFLTRVHDAKVRKNDFIRNTRRKIKRCLFP